MNKKVKIVLIIEAIVIAITTIIMIIWAFNKATVIEGTIGEEVAKWMIGMVAVDFLAGFLAWWPANVVASRKANNLD